MKPTDLHFFKSFLLNQKSSILNKTAEFKNEQREGHDKLTDEAELASADLTLNLSIHLQERDRSALLQIERALSKIAEGTYGQCESCGSLIDLRRLKARPFASLCIECMEEREETHHPLH
jgi:DnaK suppressor protein